MKRIAKFEKVSYKEYMKSHGYGEDHPKIREDYENLKLPKRATKGSAGYDFYLEKDLRIEPNETVKFATGIKCRMEEGYVLEIYPRSSLGFKYRLQLDNTVGIIDSDYYNNPDNEGHIFAKLTNHSNQVIELKAGSAYMQGIFKQFFITEDDDADGVRYSGIGSTNN